MDKSSSVINVGNVPVRHPVVPVWEHVDDRVGPEWREYDDVGHDADALGQADVRFEQGRLAAGLGAPRKETLSRDKQVCFTGNTLRTYQEWCYVSSNPN